MVIGKGLITWYLFYFVHKQYTTDKPSTAESTLLEPLIYQYKNYPSTKKISEVIHALYWTPTKKVANVFKYLSCGDTIGFQNYFNIMKWL